MPLPILQSRQDPSDADLLRLFDQTESRWCAALGEETALDVGTAYANRELADIFDANHVAQVSLPPGMSPEEAHAQVNEHFASRGVGCCYWSFNPATPEAQNRPLVDDLISRGYRAESSEVWVLGRINTITVPQVSGLKIVPTRAAQRQARGLFEESGERFGTPAFAEAELLHLDDPHWDSLVALKDGRAVATAGVLAVGEVGRIDQVYVAKDHRRQGLGLLMMARVVEICARSLFKQVLLSVHPSNAAAVGLYRRFGFRRVGPVTGYFAPGIEFKQCSGG